MTGVKSNQTNKRAHAILTLGFVKERSMGLRMITISDGEFKELVDFVYKKYGITLAKKRVLVEGRLSGVLNERGISKFSDYLAILFADKTGEEMNTLLNRITTNHTYFMREQEHFDFLMNTALPELEKAQAHTKSLKIWSAGCSSGQEAYTMAMVIAEYFGNKKSSWDTIILATDISHSVMNKAKLATYPLEGLTVVPKEWQEKYTTINHSNNTFTMTNNIRREVMFRPLNLMEPFNFKNKRPFDIIFCRNVMIYFDQQTKDKLVEDFYDVTAPGGYLCIGHSESINRATTRFNFVKPAIYKR